LLESFGRNLVISAGPAEVDNDWSGRTSGFYGIYFQKEAQKDYRVCSGVLLKIEVGIRYK